MTHPKIQSLHDHFRMVECLVFPEWQKADPARQEEIVKELAGAEAKLLLETIKNISENYDAPTNNPKSNA